MAIILVTGGTGFLGKFVVETLSNADKGHSVYSCSRSEGVDMKNYPEFLNCLKQISPDIVVHCAAHVGGIAYNRLKPVEIFYDNVILGLHVVKGCHEAGVKSLVNIMPNCTFPGTKTEFREEEWWEGPIHESVLAYGLPRKMLWGACFSYAQQHNFNSLHLILSNMYGPRDHFDPIRSHALGALLSKIVDANIHNKPSIDIWGTGKPIREWLYVKDAAESILRVIDNLDKFINNDIVNIGVGKGISIADLAQLIKETAGWQGEFIFDPSKPDGAPKKVIIADKMRSILDWGPPTKIKDGIKETYNWYLQNMVK